MVDTERVLNTQVAGGGVVNTERGMVDKRLEVARYSRLRCLRVAGLIDMQSAEGEEIVTVSARGEVVDTQPTQEGRGVKSAQGRKRTRS